MESQHMNSSRFALSPDAHRRVLREQLKAEQATTQIASEPDTDPNPAFPPASYPIGTPNQSWGDAERQQWLSTTSPKRSYQEHVLDKVDKLRELYEVAQYGALSFDPERYPLLSVQTRNWDTAKPSVLVTGGVHGYETSGVQGALAFMASDAASYSEHFNILCLPCVSPWGYETINRWNPYTVDPNRSFVPGRGSDEAEAVMNLLQLLNTQFLVHLDLHETTDTDLTEFVPAKAARDGEEFKGDVIPDGFYLVADSENPQPEWHRAMIDRVRSVTHIAPPDENGHICGEPVGADNPGVIFVPVHKIGTCSSVTGAMYATTTEVYPDSPLANDEICNLAQVAAVCSALEYVLSTL